MPSCFDVADNHRRLASEELSFSIKVVPDTIPPLNAGGPSGSTDAAVPLHEIHDGAPERRRYSQHWYPDGRVIIEAGDALFRVHAHRLIAHSTVLSAMLFAGTRRQPPWATKLVLCLNDHPDDIEHMLSAIYDPGLLSRAQLDFAVVSALLRVAAKYHIEHIRRAIVARLEFSYPSTLELFDFHAQNMDRFPIKTLGNDCSLDFLVAQLALSYKLPTVLACAIYGYGRDIPCAPQVPWDLLRKARRVLPWCRRQFGFSFASAAPSVDCTTPDTCSAALQKTSFEAALGHWSLSADALGPLESYFEPYFQDFRLPAVCGICLDHLRAMHQAARETIWSELPRQLDIPLLKDGLSGAQSHTHTDELFPIDLSHDDIFATDYS